MGCQLLATALRGPTIVLSWLLRQRRDEASAEKVAALREHTQVILWRNGTWYAQNPARWQWQGKKGIILSQITGSQFYEE